MKRKTNLTAGRMGRNPQHNETLVRDAGLKLKTRIRAGLKLGNLSPVLQLSGINLTFRAAY